MTPLADVSIFTLAVLKLGAVLAGALGGGWGLGFAAHKSGSAIIRREVPRFIVLPFRLVGAAAGGWAVFLLMGGGGFGFGGGDSLFGGRGSVAQTNLQATSTENQTVSLPPKTESPPANRAPFRIRLLGGDRVVGERFYEIDDSKTPLTLPELKERIADMRKQGVTAIEVLIYPTSVARNHPAVHELEDWAGQQGLTVTIPSTQRATP